MNLPVTSLRIDGLSESGQGLAAASGRDEQAMPYAGEVPPALATHPPRGTYFIARPGRGRPQRYAGMKTLPWTFFILGMLWYAVVWWAIG